MSRRPGAAWLLALVVIVVTGVLGVYVGLRVAAARTEAQTYARLDLLVDHAANRIALDDPQAIQFPATSARSLRWFTSTTEDASTVQELVADDHGLPAHEIAVREGVISASPGLWRFDHVAGSSALVPWDSGQRVGVNLLAGTQIPGWNNQPTQAVCGGGYPLTGLATSDLLTPRVVARLEEGEMSLCVLADPAKVAAIERHNRTLGASLGAAPALLFGATTYALMTLYRRRVQRLAERVTEAVGGADPRTLAVEGTDPALAQMTGAVNASITRLQSALAEQRDLVADVAHELRSPVATMIATLEVAQTYPEITDAAEVQETTLRQARRLQEIVGNLLVLARHDAGAPLQRAAADLTELADDVIATAPRRPDVTTTRTADGDPVAEIDAVAVRRALTNLVGNAVRHAHSQVEVAVAEVGGRAVIRVRDDGPGVPEADRERVFGRFTRLDDARTRDAGGSGLGLAIAREVARRHGGDVTIEDAPGGGAVLVLDLGPVSPGAPVSPAGPTSRGPAARAAPRRG